MFDDPKKELEKLEKQLLADEEWFKKELDSAKRMIGQDPGKPQRAAAPRAAQTPKAAPKAAPIPARESPTPEPKGIKGPLIVLAVEILGILGLGAYWMLFLLK